MYKKFWKSLKQMIVMVLILAVTSTGVEMPVYAEQGESRAPVQNEKENSNKEGKEEPVVVKEVKK